MMRRLQNIVIVLAGLFLVMVGESASAQIRIIPQSKIDSVRNPATVASRAMQFKGGNSIMLDTIAEDSGVWKQRLEWQNIGERTLVITRISSSCSCLRAESDRTPVKSGEKGSITLSYNPSGRLGGVHQRVMIYTNLSDERPTAVINLGGYVLPKTNRSGDYPCLRGGLALRRDTLQIELTGQTRIACMNVGKTALKLTADTLLSSRGVRMYTEPRQLQPGQEGDMIITYRPQGNEMPDFVRLTILGLQLPPRQRTLVLQVIE